MDLCIFFIFLTVVHFSHLASLSESYKSYTNYKLYEVHGSENDMKNFQKAVLEIEDLGHYAITIRMSAQVLVPPELDTLFEELVASNNLKAKIIFEDYSKIIDEDKLRPLGRDGGFSWTAYYDVPEIYSYLKNVSRTYPQWTSLVVGGKSYEGRQILGLRINTDPRKEGKPAMFIESGIHAREWITPATTTYFINELLTSSDPDLVSMRDQFEWHIFPTVNPDGYHYSFKYDRMWRKTRSKSMIPGCRGADPNRNWDYNWLKHGATNRPCDYSTYGGSRPFSEVETRTLSEYITRVENLQGYIAFHADAQMLLVPYSDSTDHYDNYNDLVNIGKTSLEYGYRVNGEKYDGPATAAEILYKASGGSMDWVRHALGTPLVYTYELRGTYFHWPPSRISEQGDEVTQMMVGLVSESKNLGYFRSCAENKGT